MLLNFARRRSEIAANRKFIDVNYIVVAPAFLAFETALLDQPAENSGLNIRFLPPFEESPGRFEKHNQQF
jgi:hypothetical protein